VLTTFFHHDGFLDVVASDVVAGFILVRVEQRAHLRRIQTTFKKRNLELSIPAARNPTNNMSAFQISKFPSREQLLISSQGSGSPPEEAKIDSTNNNHSNNDNNNTQDNNNDNDHDLEAGSYFAPRLSSAHPEHHGDPLYYNSQVELESLHQGFAMEEIDNWYRCSVFSLAMYTHLLALYMHPCTGLCRITCCEGMINPCLEGTRSFSSRNPSVNRRSLGSMLTIEGDNCCRMNYYGMKVLTKDLGENSELVYVSYRNATWTKPYGVFLDHEKGWIVVAVRGTLSLEDCITDAICEPTEMTEAGNIYGFDGKNKWAHGGFLKAAMQIRREIEKNNILERIRSNDIRGIGGNNITTPLSEKVEIASPFHSVHSSFFIFSFCNRRTVRIINSLSLVIHLELGLPSSSLGY
jgi:hypothetical protein